MEIPTRFLSHKGQTSQATILTGSVWVLSDVYCAEILVGCVEIMDFKGLLIKRECHGSLGSKTWEEKVNIVSFVQSKTVKAWPLKNRAVRTINFRKEKKKVIMKC